MATGTKLRRIVISTVVAAAAIASLPAAASAATVTYSNSSAFSVPDNTGNAGVDLLTSVPAGLPPVQKVEVAMAPSFPAGGGHDQRYKLRSPDGNELFVMALGCDVYPSTTSFTITDDAPDEVGRVPFCDNQLNGGTGSPSNPAGDRLSIFNGKPSGGEWVLNVHDGGLNATQGTLNSWGVRITHEPLTVTGKAKKQAVKKSAKVSLSCNADCDIKGGGDAKGRTFEVDQNETEKIAFPIKGKALNRVEDGGKLKLKLTVTDAIGDVVAKTVKVKVK